MDHAAPAECSLPIVHAVTNDEIVTRPGFVARAREVMQMLGPRGALQLRAPRLAAGDAEALLATAQALADAQAESGAWLVINDRVDIALIARARGVQLTGRSLEPTDATRVIAHALETASPDSLELPAPLVGASVHSLEEAVAARLGGASWAVVSHVLAARGPRRAGGTRSEQQPDSREALTGTALVEQLVRYSGLPIVAIGGVVPQHVAPLRKLGVYGVAAIRGIWDAENAGHAACEYLSAYDPGVGR